MLFLKKDHLADSFFLPVDSCNSHAGCERAELPGLCNTLCGELRFLGVKKARGLSRDSVHVKDFQLGL